MENNAYQCFVILCAIADLTYLAQPRSVWLAGFIATVVDLASRHS